MFKQRLITALVLIPLVLLLIYFGSYWMLVSAVGFLIVVCGYEWMPLIPLDAKYHKALFFILLVLGVVFRLYLPNTSAWIGLCMWTGIYFSIVTYPKSQTIWGKSLLVGLLGILLLPLGLLCLINIYLLPDGKNDLVYFFCLVWAADIGAYLAGRRFGQHKLIPTVSPGKTIEGLCGGLIFGAIVATGGYLYWSPKSILAWYMMALLTVCLSVVGDLFISMLKRRCKLKDTGNIIPGHGGLLDRLDSLLPAAPFFFYGFSIMMSGS